MAHRLDPLLRPKSMAVVGATAREGSVGNRVIQNLLKGNYSGELYAVNPRYEQIEGVPCFTSLSDLPGKVDHVVFALSDARLEDAFDETIKLGIKAVTIYSTLVLADDSNPPLKTRIQKKARGAKVMICGGNGMGFYNFDDGIWNCGFSTRNHRAPGDVTFISQSGSGMAGIIDVEGRIDFNLAVSTGQELTVTMSDYLDFALDMPTTKVVGLFMETVRDVPAMTAALEKAEARRIPVIAIKVGRTELAARLTVSHSGAIAGNDDAYNAYFDRHGVMRVSDMDELATVLIMFAQPHDVGPGGLVSMHDSGGERQLVIDLADEHGATLTKLNAASVAELKETLEPELPAVNPLDSWSKGGEDFDSRAAGYLTTMMNDPGAAIGAVIQDRNAESSVAPEYIEYLRMAHRATGKPAFLVAGRQGTGTDPLAVNATRDGFPVLDGVSPFLKGIKLLFDHRDFTRRTPTTLPSIDQGILGKWKSRLRKGDPLAEADGAELLKDFGIEALSYRPANSAAHATDAAKDLGFPVTLKTAKKGLAHKSDQGGVKLNIKDADDLAQAYTDMSKRLGPDVYVTPMVTDPGVEMILGMIADEQFGPLVVLGFGGIHAETFKDVVSLLPPFGAKDVMEKLGTLRLAPLLAGSRGNPPVKAASFADAAARFSVLAHTLGDSLQEIDVNPILVTATGCIALDALVVTRGGNERKV